MSLNEKQVKWLDGFAAVKIKGDEARDAVEARRLVQNRIEVEMMDKRDDLRAFLETVTLTIPPETAFESLKASLGMAETIRLLEPGGNPMKELDIDNDAAFLAKGIAPEQAREVQEKLLELYALSADLENMTHGDPPQKVYNSPEELRADFWDPLVREGVIPENFVPPRFSEVDTTFGAASELYEERLQEYTKELGDWDGFADKFNVAATCVELGFDFAGAVIQAKAAVGVLQAGGDLGNSAAMNEAKEKVELLKLIGAAVAAVGAGTKTAIKEKDVVKSMDSFTKAVVNSVSAAAGSGVGKEVGSIMTAVVHAYPFAKRIKTWRDTGVWDWSEAISDLGDAVASGISAGDGKSDSDFYANIGKAVKAGFESVSAGVKTLGTESEDRAFDVLVAQFGAAATSMGSAIVSIMKEKENDAALKKEETEKGRALTKEEAAEVTKKVDEDYETTLGILENEEDLEKIAEFLKTKGEVFPEAETAFDAGEKKRLLAEAEAAQTAALKDFMETPDATFEAMLASGFSEDAYGAAPEDGDDSPEAVQARVEQEERRIKSIENLIAIQKKNDATYELSKTIVATATKVGVQALANVIPGLSIANVAQEMMYSMYEAAKQGSEFLIWQDNVAIGNAAHTVQVEAILSRHGLQKKQTIEAGIAAALKAAQLVGEVLKLAGHAAPVGVAVAMAATTATGLLQAASKVATEVSIRKAWNDYQTALARPQNRKAVRTALRNNPTLAKYAMAYGAVVDNNPIAKEVMRRCGLNDSTLADPSANVAKVVKYMETLYKDDPIVLRTTTVPKGWYPGGIELKAGSWTMFVYNAQNSNAKDAKIANPLLAPIDATGVAGSLTVYETATAAAGTGNTDPEKCETLKAAIEAAGRLELAFARFKPMTVEDSSKKHPEFTEYVQALSGQCTLQKRAWQATLAALEAAIAKAAAEAEIEAAAKEKAEAIASGAAAAEEEAVAE